jgi:hypothetical protein
VPGGVCSVHVACSLERPVLCAQNRCKWRADAKKVFIEWGDRKRGDAGLHVVKLSAQVIASRPTLTAHSACTYLGFVRLLHGRVFAEYWSGGALRCRRKVPP